MKFTDIPTRMLNVRIKCVNHAASLSEGPVLSLAPSPNRSGEFGLRNKDALVVVKPVLEKDARRLANELASGCAVLAQLANPASDDSIELQIAFFNGECLEMEDLEIGTDEYVEQTYASLIRSRKSLSVKQLYEALYNHYCYIHGDQPYFFFFAGPAVEHNLHPEQEKNSVPEADESEDNNAASDMSSKASALSSPPSRPELSRKNSLCIIGDRIRCIVTETALPDEKSIYIITRLTKSKDAPDRALRLAKGKLTFSNWTRAGQIKMLAKAQMSALSRDEGSYLKRWDEFMEVEGELLFAQARKIGSLQYSDATATRDGTVTVRITQASDSALEALAAREAESLEMVDDLPEYLTNMDLTFTQFTGAIEKEVEHEAYLGKTKNRQKKFNPYYGITEYDAKTKTLALKTENLPASGMLILSLAGQIAQIKRRLFARKAIQEGRAANPQLGLLIEDKGEIAPTRSHGKIKPLSAFIANKVFRNPPTEKQREAIAVALNTPDIALIQGPPGTGKTTVIAAIIERLSELADKSGASVKGSILLTGLQHDAVENMIERISLNGLPVPKFGKRSGNEEDDFSVFEKKLQEWCMERGMELRAKNPRLADIEEETKLKNLCLQYLKAPTRVLALDIAKKIINLGITTVGEECVRKASNLAHKLSLEEQLNAESNPLLKAVRGLRHTPEAFLDDGPARAADVLDDLSSMLETADYALLKKASIWHNTNDVPPFLNDIAALKKRLLYKLTIPPVFRVEKQNDEVLALVEEASKTIRINGISAKDAKSAILAEFLAELEANPYGMKDAVSDYAFAFSSTCQQSVNTLMQEQKGIKQIESQEDFQKLEYEYVIVDEAARVTPPDLMVAMAQGKRIILVGDHRQLPHIIDEAVAQQMEAGETGKQEAEWLKKSMFQHLFSERLKALEKNDGIVRRVTLDKQYRMHPLLGEFISGNFYERFDSSEKFTSGLPESDFAHNLPDTNNSPAVWLDVPYRRGKHQRSGTSWTRPVEAAVIARQLQKWMNPKAGADLSFGVISFYKAQAELIKRQLGKITEDEQKLRIGTVDSFQGMEFDVVILSMVRTMPGNWKPNSDDEEKQARGLFGHLCLYNRLNVSMSRQKRLLVVAGDAELLQHELASKHIPGLFAFYQLCQTHGRVLPCT